MNKVVLVLIVSFLSLLGHAQMPYPSLLPSPQQVEWKDGNTPFDQVSLAVNKNSDVIEQLINSLGSSIDVNSSTQLKINMVEKIDKASVNPNEAYHLLIENNKIQIEAISDQGVFWAFQTIRQLIAKEGDELFVQNCDIIDWPAFKVRGFMHDVGRGFIPVDELKKQIDLLSQFKVNVFHWHLTEDIGWRLESKVFPGLTAKDNFERLHGQYYTIEEAKELVQFCIDRHVWLIPEIDMPGHSAAFTRALGHDMQSKEGMRLLKQLMDEVCEVFADVPYLHIGTDEVRFTNRDFVPEMVDYIRAKGKKVISWNPG
ncbi:family 20 glycosylhydrolase [Carboxylicivirga sp. N1Y90]|uniref:family 20 glycosylhydrolase n=1 Tax=Carboxylicivirga fragile TaxID=3417571 RepID=UPI003D3537E2|nr:family 20 glycosylhydrolase [Marinilabiliaceae bacterium N1Y90]